MTDALLLEILTALGKMDQGCTARNPACECGKKRKPCNSESWSMDAETRNRLIALGWKELGR